MDLFIFNLEETLSLLHRELNDGTYRHGSYRIFTVNDNKRREIAVAPIRDRAVHRLMYDYLVEIYDKTFLFDVWSCRKGKGLVGAIERTESFLRSYPESFVWSADVKKFFDSVEHETLLSIISRRISDTKALSLAREIIKSYPPVACGNEREREYFRVPKMEYAGYP